MKILLTGAFRYSEKQFKTIESLGWEVTFIQDERVSLDIDVSKFEAVVCNNLFLYNDIKRFKSLKFIQLTSAGLDRVPMDYIKEKDIKIANTKDVYSVPMAEWVILKILEIYKNSKQFFENQKQRIWKKERGLLELTDKTVSIIGFGSVGKEIAKRLKVFNVKIIGVGRRKFKDNLLDEYYRIQDINKVFRKSDIIILTLPLTNETKNLINKKRIEQMKDRSVMINVSRGGIIDEEALIVALKNDKFLGVALDVFKSEPLDKNNPLWNFENVIITPHNSFVSDKVQERLFQLIIKNLKSIM